MSERDPSFEPRTALTGRELAIAALGAIGFRIELGPNANIPETDTLKPELYQDPLIFVETVHVKDGVVCDVYKFRDDKSKDLGIITVKNGFKTPLQKVLQGTRTTEGFVSGSGKLTVVRGQWAKEELTFPNDYGENEVNVFVGDTMQWEAIGDQDLVFYEVCEPPYIEGRFQDLD